jgi:ketosteroid isomerase-like protein
MSRNETEIVDTFTNYSIAFETLDPRAVLPYYYEPCMLISPQGVAVMTTREQVVEFFTKVMTDLRERAYVRSVMVDLEAKQLSDTLAIVSGVGVWYKSDGNELQRFGLTYTLRRGDAGWKIVVGAVHDVDAALRLA